MAGAAQTRFSEDLLYSLIPYFRSGRYPVCPVLTEEETRAAVADAVNGGKDGALGYAVAAVSLEYMNSQTGPGSGPDKETIESLVRLSIASKGPIVPDFDLRLKAVVTSSFISDALVTVGKLEASWMHLNESIGMLTLLRIGETETLDTLDPCERARQLRLYWMLFIHERFLVLHMRRTRVLLRPLREYPQQVDDIPPEVHRGFLHIIKLFEHVDQTFVNAVVGADEVDDVDPEWIEAKANALETFSSSLPPGLTEVHQADQIISAQWMVIVLWQVAMSRFWLSSTTATSGIMAITYPIAVTRKLQRLITDIDTEAIQAQGYGINQKLYELTIAIAEVIPLIPPDRLKLEVDKVESFVWIARYLLTQSTVLDNQKLILEEKLERIISL